MTIIQPNRRRGRINMAVLFGVIFFIIMAVVGVFIYNQNVELRYGIRETKIEIAELKAVNADLREALYEKLDFADINVLVNELGLVKDASPDYFLALQ